MAEIRGCEGPYRKLCLSQVELRQIGYQHSSFLQNH